MRRLFVILLIFATLTGWAKDNIIISKKEGRIVFKVDGGLSPVDEGKRYYYSGTNIANQILREERVQGACIIDATSFAKNKHMRYFGKDAFFQCMVEAYAKHKSVVLSPDMVWLLISQGFARYVNAHSEELRARLVSHTGKMDLVVESKVDSLTNNIDWSKVVNDFASQIERYTKDDIAKTITADFSTTKLEERVASKITLMESVKSYFEFIEYYAACGIPSITLTGTPEDWRNVLAKTKRLESYGLGKWTKSLEPILAEFVSAAEGNPNRKFWKDIVKKRKVEELQGSGCSSKKPTILDGWMLKLFPDENGVTLDSVYKTKEMPSERVRVEFKHRVLSPVDGSVKSEIPMELWAGFVGAVEDSVSNTLIPKIGWMVTSFNEEAMLKTIKQWNDKGYYIDLRIKDVPKVLASIEHIKKLRLVFIDDVVLPNWFYKLQIDELSIKGKVTEETRAEILEHFPKASLSDK